MKPFCYLYTSNSKPLPYSSKNKDLKAEFLSIIHKPEIGFYRLENLAQNIETIHQLSHDFFSFDTLVHIGLGGSVLGPKALTDSLLHSEKIAGKKIVYLDNLDPEDFYECLEELDLKKTLFYIVSKSGETLETKAMLHGLLQKIQTSVKKDHFLSYLQNNLLICTDPKNGFLRSFAKSHKIPTVDLPTNLGGRFSVLSAVGLIPLAFIHQGFKDAAKNLLETLHEEQTNQTELPNLIELAIHIVELYQKKHIDQTVFMPYLGKLKTLSLWFAQLWGESLGKSQTGLTPLAAIGTSDQHSLLQLLAQGPKNKFVLFLKQNQSSRRDFLLNPLTFLNNEDQIGFQATQGFKFDELREACLWGTTTSLSEVDVPSCTIAFETLNIATMGKLFFQLESLTVLVSLLLKIDAFNQPGVERGKILAKEFLAQKHK